MLDDVESEVLTCLTNLLSTDVLRFKNRYDQANNLSPAWIVVALLCLR